MDFSPAKRRKVDHPASQGPVPDGAAALDAPATAATSRPSTFVLQTQELLGEVRLDYEKCFAAADDLLYRIKSTIEAIEPQDPTPVSFQAKKPTHGGSACPAHADMILTADSPGHSRP